MHEGRQDGRLEALRAAVRDGRSIVITGEAGIGKSTLADALAGDLFEHAHIERLAGTPAIADVAFSAVAHLLSGQNVPLPELLTATVLATIADRADGRPTILIADDANLLDVGSTAVLQQFHAHGGVVVATVRTEHLDSPVLTPLASHADVIELEVMSLEATTELISLELQAPITLRLASTIHELSLGNPFLSLALARKATTITLDDATIDLAATTTPFGDISDLTGSAGASLDEDGARALDLLAVAEPITDLLAHKLGILDVAEQLEVQSLIASDIRSGQLSLRTAHPLIGEARREAMTSLRRKRLVGELADAMASLGADQAAPGLVRAALWAAEAGVALDLSLAHASIRAAMSTFDVRSALVLLGQVPPANRSVEIEIMAAKALALSGDTEESTAALRRADNRSTTERERADVALAEAELQLYVFADEAAARARLEDRFADLVEPIPRAEIGSMLILAAAMEGDFEPAFRLGDELLETVDLPPDTELGLIIGVGLGQVSVGPRPGLADRLDRGEQLALAAVAHNPVAIEQIIAERSMLRLANADVLGAAEVWTEFSTRMVDTPMRLAPSGGFLGFVESMIGRAQATVDASNRAKDALAVADPLGIGAMVGATLAQGLAVLGDTAAARREIAAARAHPASGQPRSSVIIDRAEVWALMAQGDEISRHKAVDLAATGGARAADSGHPVWGAVLAHDAVRFGAGDAVAPLLRRLCEAEHHAAIVALLADHADAAASQDLEALVDVAKRVRAAGMYAVAVCALVQASRVETGQARLRRELMAHELASQTDVEARFELAGCEHPLSERERDVVALARSGATSRAIAEELFLGARTVENHLGRIYKRLGLNGRDHLADLLS